MAYPPFTLLRSGQRRKLNQLPLHPPIKFFSPDTVIKSMDTLAKKIYPTVATLATVALIATFATPQARSQPPQGTNEIADSADKDYSGELPRIPAMSLAEAEAALEVLPGFTVQLIAAEPLVSDPIAFAFDAQQRLFVVEMRDYSEQADEHLGRVARLVDRDGDGVYDERTTFVEGLSWPTALWPWRDGVLVAEPPRLTWYRDIDQDGKSDAAEDWFVGFARSNVQGLVNSLRWGVDGFIHGATSSSGATIESLANSGSQVALGRRDFAIDPLNQSLHPKTGGGQHGLSFNRWGDKFVTSNSDHLQQILDLESWLEAHPSRVPMPSVRRSIAEDGPQAEVFRSSPIEPWRIVRTRLRVSGVAPGIVEGGGRAAGYFTGATGTCIVDGLLGFGVTGHDTALVCDVGSNLVHRKQLSSNGLYWTATRIDEGTELLRSRDIWFRPVQLGDGPDGAVYIADMAREVIEHPHSLPPMIKKHLDLTSGRELGRIWRLAPSSLEVDAADVRCDLSQLDSAALIERLGHRISWQRLMASQLLIERGTEQNIAPKLREYIAKSDVVHGRLLAMQVAARLGLADAELLRVGLQSSEPRLVECSMNLLSQSSAESSLVQELAKELGKLAENRTNMMSDARVQLSLAMVAADLPPAQADTVLARLLASSDEPLLMSVVATAAGDRSWQLVRRGIEADGLEGDRLQKTLSWLLPVWSRQISEGTDRQPLQQWLGEQLQPNNPQLTAWLDALSLHGDYREAARIWQILGGDQQTVLREFIDSTLASTDEPRTIGWTVWLQGDQQLAWLEKTLVPSSSEPVQAALIAALARQQSPALAKYMLAHIREFTPRIQEHALRALSSSQAMQQQLAEALEAGSIPISLVTAEFRQRLSGSSDEKLAERFKKLFTSSTSDRADVIARYQQMLDNRSSATNEGESGEQVFRRACAQCHQLQGIGTQVGPALQQLGDKSPQQLLETILDPNREVDPRYVGYGVMMLDGRLLTGIIRDESAGQIVLQEAGGTNHSIVRSDIEQLKSSGLSLMPEGLEAQVTPEQMQALIDFLRQVK